jgi:hypothetical protein
MSCCNQKEAVTIEFTIPPCQLVHARQFLAFIGEPDTEENIRRYFIMMMEHIWDQACRQHRLQEGRCDPGGGPLSLDGEEPIFRD